MVLWISDWDNRQIHAFISENNFPAARLGLFAEHAHIDLIINILYDLETRFVENRVFVERSCI